MVKRQQQTDIGILNLGDNLFYLMCKWGLMVDEMARRCDVSTRKFCEIIYKEPKWLRFSTLRAISDNIGISIGDLISKNLSEGGAHLA